MTTRKASKGKEKQPAKSIVSKAKVLQDEARRDAKTDPRNNDAKIDDLQKNTEDSGGEFLTTNQGVRINDNQNSLKAGERARRCLKTSSCARRLRTSITSAFLSAWFTRAARRRMVISRFTNRWRSIRKLRFCRIRQ